ncbi:hypothetical protein [Chlorobium ferrooxidans]|uniref:Uncharacterized protein n=1 Tax=Chlorobium ferrooxidans DSM 13031 TaxID=377431 RepID=Q0YSD8_9CHLB|nr:hypothetical protein [Chlorobium ferrooxidans]EAT59289.1 hypothetical protein CferDRAFT_1296 [Chlorobium ferrooxidans DSM 13031]
MSVNQVKNGGLQRLVMMLFLFITFFAFGSSKAAFAAPAVLEVGVSTSQTDWVFNPPQQNPEVKFWMRVQRQGNLSRFGTFDYYFKVQVLRPDGSEVWNTRYGFSEEGYSEQVFSLPILFYERSADRAHPSFGTWRIRVAMTEKDSGNEVSAKEYLFNFSDGRNR